MGASKQAGGSGRRTFSAKFKAETVRLIVELRAAGTSLARILRELAVPVHPSQLRAWAKAQSAAVTPGEAVPGETLEQEYRRLRRELGTVQQEQALLKNTAVDFPKESRLGAPSSLAIAASIPCNSFTASCMSQWTACTRISGGQSPSGLLWTTCYWCRCGSRSAQLAACTGALWIERGLWEEELSTSRKRVVRLMQADWLVASPAPRRNVGRTDSRQAEPIDLNRLQ
jgi:transposase-like protein